MVLWRRAATRRVCHYCEHDPIRGPRLPAVPSQADPGRCARCDHPLLMRRCDAPDLYRARRQRYYHVARGIRRAFAAGGVGMTHLDSGRSLDDTTRELAALLTSRANGDKRHVAHAN
jgi:hypothetical protein